MAEKLLFLKFLNSGYCFHLMNTKEKPNRCKGINHSTLKQITELCNLVFQLYFTDFYTCFPVYM